MPGWDGAGALHAVRLRLTKLNADGSPLVGATSQIVSSALVRFAFTPTYSEGQEVEQKNGADELCLYYKAPRSVKAIQTALQICTPDPQIEQLLAGGEVLVDGADIIGYAAPEVGANPTPNGVSVEVWTRAIIGGAQASDLPWIQWVFPRQRFSQDERAMENAPQIPAYTGQGEGNGGWGTGPMDDWDLTSDRLWQWRRTDEMPAPTDGLVAVAAPA